ncbi:TrkA C-terminal domain-containing protein [Halobellus sp. H-GB7]|uniref:TrkA C-terminal domain-containing protein n=1 Tax=Halobellus sp. H-GB7 TaxID=3069756 RepID=UPI0027B66C85|nr:TrkA C-terminal domain-containing protein [Halobellus sp. H-GB7]MDQ2055161.1 TrkA C-terminal domain-containing protein [Halobellus sp. H-GB7]
MSSVGVALTAPLQLGDTIPADPSLIGALTRVVGLAAVAAIVAAAAAVVYRWYTREEIPAWLATLTGASGVALYLNAVGLFQQAVGSDPAAVFDPMVVLVNAAALGAAIVVSPAGRAVGDRLTTSAFAVVGARELDTEVSRLVSNVGRVRAVELPEVESDVDDIEGYEPVPAATKDALAGKTLLVPRNLRGDALRDRVVARIKEDYGVGYVDLELDDDGTVTRLGLGRRVAGLGTTLAPGFAAVAVRADPGAGASAGDAVQLWRRTEAGEGAVESASGTAARVASGELRAVTGDVATVVVDEADAENLDPAASYRLLTLPSDPGAEREFTSLLRAADETMDVVTVGAGSDLDGATVGDVDATVAAVRPTRGAIEPIPARSRTLAAGDALYLVARPERLRDVATLAAA